MFCSNKTHLDESYLDIFCFEQGTNRKQGMEGVGKEGLLCFFFPLTSFSYSMKFCDKRAKMVRIVN